MDVIFALLFTENDKDSFRKEMWGEEMWGEEMWGEEMWMARTSVIDVGVRHDGEKFPLKGQRYRKQEMKPGAQFAPGERFGPLSLRRT